MTRAKRGGAGGRGSKPRSAATPSALVFVAALAVHAVVWLQYRDDPLHDGLVADALFYHDWAARVATGGLGDEAVFHQAPLFPIVLAGCYRLAGVGAFDFVLWVQMLLSSLAIALVVPIGRWFFRSTGAGVAGACVALAYAPLAFHAMKLLPVSLAIASQALALALLGAARAGRRAAVPLAGLACGVACLARAEFLLFAPIAFASLWLDRRRPTGARRVAAGLFAAGVLVAIAPATLHNLSHGDRVLIASSAGENLFVGNQRGGNGGHSELHPSAGDLHSQRVWAVRIAERETGRPLVPSAVSRYWSGRALGEIAADPVAWLALEGRKLMRILDPADPTDMYSLALERSLYLPVLYLLPLSTTGLWVLGAAGLVGAWRRRREDAWPLLAAVAVQFLVLLAFFVSTRLRVPLLFLLTPFAGLAVSSGLARLVERRRVVPLLATAAIVLLGSVHWLVLLRPPPREAVRLASVLSLRDRLDESLEIVAPWTGPEREDALALDQAGWVHNKKGHLDAARRLYLRALELGLPSAAREAQTRTRLAALYEREGDVLRATRQHDAAVAAMPDSAPMRHARGLFLLRQGRVREAADDFREAARLAPGWPEPLAMLRSLGLPPPDAGATAEGRAPRQAK